METESLLKIVRHRSVDVRLAAVKILRERAALPIDIAGQLMLDESSGVRLEALFSIEAAGRIFTDAEAKSILVKPANQGLLGWGDRDGEVAYEQWRDARLKRLSESEVNGLIDKAFPFESREYLARAEMYYAKYGDELKSAIEDAFEAYFAKSVEKLAQITSDDVVKQFAQLQDSIRNSLSRNGLSVIERKRNAGDLTLVRKVLRSGFVAWSDDDAAYLGSFGEWQDINILSALVDKPDYRSSSLFIISERARFKLAASAIYKLSRTRFRDILEANVNKDIMRILITLFPDKAFRDINYNLLKSLLCSPISATRRAAVIKVVRALSRAKTKRLLSQYMDEEQRYYDVIYWLDFGINLPRETVALATARELAEINA